MENSQSVSVGKPFSKPAWTEPPGGILVWMIVFVELLTFGLGLVVFQVQAQDNAGMFREGRASLNQSIGVVNTMVLLTGGWFMTIVIGNLRQGETTAAARWLIATILSGGVFLGLKSFEFADKLNHGYDLHADTFFTLYWLLTGFHFIHVGVAVIILLVMWRGIRSRRYKASDFEDVESSGIFWHMCDAIWLLLYPVIYLLP